MASLFQELRQRHVIRVAGMYAVAGWLIIEVGMALETTLNLPDWFDTMVTVLVIIGFPIALVLAWVFDLTRDGVKRTASDGQQTVPARGGLLDIGIIVGLAGVAGLVIWQSFGQPETSGTGTPDTVVPIRAEDRSIAVLPFVALSSNQDDDFFGKGISEELLNSLAKFPNLKVAARTSAFSFGGKDVDLRDVGQQLGVAHVLEGSVRRSGDRLRITAQLIRAADGFHLWSETYDRMLTDVFEIQDDIVGKLSLVLQFRLGVGAGAGRADSVNTTPQAYETYLKGIDLWWDRERDANNRTAAINAFQSAVEIDPDFADGWAALANSLALSNPTTWPKLSVDDGHRLIDAAYKKALALEPQNTRALAGKAYWLISTDVGIVEAGELLAEAQSIAPNDGFVQYITALNAFAIGNVSEIQRALERTLANDPLNETKQRVAVTLRAALGDFDGESRQMKELYTSVSACIDARSCEVGDVAWTSAMAMHAIQANDAVQSGALYELAAEALTFLEGAESVREDWACSVAIIAFLREGSAAPDGQIIACDYASRRNTLISLIGEDLLGVSVLARMGFTEQALALLNNYDSLKQRVLLSTGAFAFSNGPLEMPEVIRRHPDYHAFWQQRGMADLAAIRRANGIDAGLPLPFEP
ncbi:MAG: hypothetical protein AB8F65_14035 [Woeseiaceae bacterium]